MLRGCHTPHAPSQMLAIQSLTLQGAVHFGVCYGIIKLAAKKSTKWKESISTLSKQHITSNIGAIFPQALGLDWVVAGEDVASRRRLVTLVLEKGQSMTSITFHTQINRILDT